MKTQVWVLILGLTIGSGLSSCFGGAFCTNRAIAQIAPDQTLPAGERSVVADISSRSLIPGSSDTRINGGAIVEAQGWIKHQGGTIALVAAHPSGISQPFLLLSCP